jgi:glutathione S-transferase
MKLYRFVYSPYARKVQMLLDLLGVQYDLIEVNYVEREELAKVTGGYIMVPVLIDDEGAVIVESRQICERLVESRGAQLVPSPFEGPIWAYSDFVDGPLEDILFRIASPSIRDRWTTAFERGLYVFSKERKFGAGCVDAWERDCAELLNKGRKLVAPSIRTLERQSFLFGAKPTLADAALYGVCAMLEAADPELLKALSPGLVDFSRRLEAARAA